MKRRRISQSRAARLTSRRGVVLLMVLVCLALMMALLGTMMQASIVQRRQIRYESWQIQTQWLAESGLSRAVNRLRSDKEYDGETWKPSNADALSHDAKVVIKIEQNADKATVTVVAEYATETQRPMRVTRAVTVQMQEIPSGEEAQ